MTKRRGHINSEQPKAGTPLYVIKADMPALDSFGFETDLRVYTAGQAFGLTQFDHWEIAPGDPLDRTIKLKLLEPSPPPMLARDIMVKTRRRKGLLEDLTIAKFFDDQTLIDMVKMEPEFKSYF